MLPSSVGGQTAIRHSPLCKQTVLWEPPLTALGLGGGQHQEPGPGPPQGCGPQHSKASCTASRQPGGGGSRSGPNCWELTLES